MNELDELIKDRQEKVRLMKKDGDNSHKLLADLYGSPTHFITELLQNAEDEGAKNVSFKLIGSDLIFSHDAKKLFDFSDIRAISNFGDNQEKKEKPNAIGRFGIGFKSVYSITENPRIVSANFDITIRDYNIPENTNEGYATEFFQGTKIILPFKNEKRAKAIELLNKELKDLNLHYLLFLSNISSIKWETENEIGLYERITNKKDNRFVTLKSSSKELKYFLIEKVVQIDNKKLSIKIAFQLADTDKKAIVPSDKSPLFVFFPTKIETNLKFLVHAPFYTTPARENIQEGDNLVNIETDHRNEKLKIELGKLLVESLSVFKSLRLLNVDLLNVLPIDKGNCQRSPIYKEMYDAVKAELKSNKQLLPNAYGGLSPASDVMLLGSADLVELLDPKQAKKLFGRSFWLSKKITTDKTKTLRDYLFNDISIPEYDLTGFANKIDVGFIVMQSDKWLIQFYNIVHKAPALWRVGSSPHNNGVLRSKPIIRVESKDGVKQVIPFQHNGKPNVFLPTKEYTKYATVKLNIAKNKEARKFLEDLGLTTPDLFAEVNEFVIPKLRTGETYPGYFQDFKKILEASQSTNQEKRNRLIQDLKECLFVFGYNIATGETKHLKYSEVYFFSENLKTYFGTNPSVFFVAEEQYSFNQNELDKFRTFLTEIGVGTTLWRREFSPNFTRQEKAAIRKNASITYENYCKDYKLDGLTEFLSGEISVEKSVALWQLLVKCISFGRFPQPQFFQGDYSFKYYSDYRVNFDAFFLRQLKQVAWLVISDQHFMVNEISYSSLPDIYKDNGNDSRILGDILGFKPDEIKDIEDRIGGKFLSGERLKKFEQWEAEQIKNESKSTTGENEDEGFTPEFTPKDTPLQSRELDENDISIEFGSGQGISLKKTNETVDDETLIDDGTNQEIPAEKINTKLLKDIGNWGQDYVFRDLCNEFEKDTIAEVVDLNKDGQLGVGADFKVTKAGEIIRLIEVKSTVEPFGQTLSISGTQWEVARNYFKENNGDKYWVYCVFNAGQISAEIVKVKNPIQKWKDGKLFAHPINFIIK